MGQDRGKGVKPEQVLMLPENSEISLKRLNQGLNAEFWNSQNLLYGQQESSFLIFLECSGQGPAKRCFVLSHLCHVLSWPHRSVEVLSVTLRDEDLPLHFLLQYLR